MKRLIYLIPLLVLFSCKSNQECKDDIFGDFNWINSNTDSKGYYDNFRFGDDDTLTLDQSSMGYTDSRVWYKFKPDCSGFYLSQEEPVAFFEITSQNPNQVTLQNNQYTLVLNK
jgi:hypothetical protein